MDNDQIVQLLTTLMQGMQNQAKKVDELNNQLGEIVEFMGQMQEQSELSYSTIEIAEAITLDSGMEVGDEPKTSKPSQNMDEHLLLEEEKDHNATVRDEQPLPQPPKAPPPSNSGPNNKVGKKVHFGAIWSNFGPKWIACIWSKWDGRFWCFKKGFNTCKNLNNEVEVWKCADTYT
ncbi:hypothetical protein COP2_025451 [Malus domestica]